MSNKDQKRSQETAERVVIATDSYVAMRLTPCIGKTSYDTLCSKEKLDKMNEVWTHRPDV